MMFRVHAVLLAGVLLLAGIGPAPAQGWLDDARKLFESTTGGGSGALGEDRIADGLKEALRVATGRAVEEVGHPGGYLDDPRVHIPLPRSLRTVQDTLRQVGLSGLADDLEVRLNRAAEAAAPEARDVFVQAIQAMTLEDARRIYEGPDDAATRYFQKTMTPDLKTRMRPIVERSLEEAQVLTAYDRMMGQYQDLPFVPDASANLSDYTLEQGLEGLFHYLAEEEKAIRQDPAARTTELLKEVFGGGA